MKYYLAITNITAAVALGFAISACSTQEEMVAKPAAKPAAPAPAAKAEAKAEAKGDAKAAATKLAGDVGLLDTEKNYLIIVTKEGKLVTVDYDPKFQPTERGLSLPRSPISALAPQPQSSTPRKATRASLRVSNIYQPRASSSA